MQIPGTHWTNSLTQTVGSVFTERASRKAIMWEVAGGFLWPLHVASSTGIHTLCHNMKDYFISIISRIKREKKKESKENNEPVLNLE